MKKILFTVLIASIYITKAYTQTYSVNTTCSNSFTDISTTGTATGLADDGYVNVTMPFSFTFYGSSSTSLRISNNGAILFGVTTGTINSANSAITAGSPSAIFPFWDDLYTGGNVYYQTIGTTPNRKFIIQWNRNHLSCTSGNINVEAVLSETTNEINFLYQDLLFDASCTSYNSGSSATVGIKGASSVNQFSYNTSFSNTCISYLPCNAPAATITKTCAPNYLSYSLSVDVTSLGDATGVDITNGTTTYFSNVGLGTYTIPSITTATTIYIQNHAVPSCKMSQAIAMCDVCSSSTTLPTDECVNAPLIDLSQPFAGSTNCTYTASAGSPSACGQSIENDSWIKFIAASTNVEMDFTVGDCNLNFGVQLAVFSGACGGLTLLTGSCVSPSPTPNENTTGTWNFSGLTIGNTYYIRIDGYAGDKCPYFFTPISGVVITPPNDLCADAIVLTCGSSDTASNILATATDAPTACSGGGSTSKGVWYKFVGTGQSVTISTDDANTNFDTEINVFSGTCGSLTCVGGDDDSGSGTTSSYTFSATNGITYYVYVDGKGTAQGQFKISLSCVGCSANPGTWN